MAIFVKKTWRNRIHRYNWVNERIINIIIKVDRGYLTILEIYAPEEGRKGNTEEFYKELQKHLLTVNNNDYMIIAGDFNARVGNKPVKGVMGTNGEAILSQNCKVSIDFAAFNDMRITNTFFKHRNINKYTWSQRDTQTIIDYITN